jgi:hypothetical protein
LDVNGRINVRNGIIQKGGSAITSTSDLGLYSFNAGEYIRFVTNNAPVRFFSDGGTNPIGNNVLFSIEANGKVSIGVPNNKMVGNYNLYVKDGILTEHCRVALQTSADWGDWVFDKDNKRMTFEEQSKYYYKNKHLQHIPSASAIKKEGLDVADMFTGVVINLEETRLDNIALHTENQQQKTEIEAMKMQMKQLQLQIEKLEKKQ